MKKTKRIFGARAVMTLLLAMLTTMTAWAQTVTVPELTVTNVTITSAAVSWTACDGVSSYTLQLASNEEFTEGSLLAEYSVADGSSYTFTGLTSSKTYYTRVKGDADWSNVVEFVTSVPNILYCNITVPNQMYRDGNSIGYNFEDAGHGGVIVSDANDNVLTYGTDYSIGWPVSLDFPDDDPCTRVGEHCQVTISGEGEWVGKKTVNFEIIPVSGNGTWGDLSWSYSEGKLTISGTGAMADKTNNTNYPWIDYADDITNIIIGDKITSIGKEAFGGKVFNESTYPNLTTISLPSTLTAIGTRAFYCSSNLSLTIPASVTTIGTEAFQSVACVTVSLSDTDNNTTLINGLIGATSANVTISDRTLSKSSEWNTLCLPFDVSAEQMAATTHPLYGATIMELDNAEEATSLSDTGVLTLKFKSASSIEAGKPYIIKWETTGANIENPKFNEVNITSTTPTAVKSYDNKVTFVGQYSPFKIGDVDSGDDGNLNEIIMLGANNELGYSNNERSLKCFRAHFYVKSDGSEQAARAFVLDFDDETTSLSEELRVKSEEFATAAEWYSLDGRKLTGKPTQKGVYIVNGKKIVVK